MNEIILFALLGLGTGAVTAGLAISVVVTFRGSLVGTWVVELRVEKKR